MMFLILDKNPTEAALSVPPRLKHKQVLELMQMISEVVNFGYKPLPQGKVLKKWIGKHKAWTYAYVKVLMADLNLSKETEIKYNCLLRLLGPAVIGTVRDLETAIFRYEKEYEGSKYPTDSELPIDIAVEEYKRYLEYKEKKWREKHGRKVIKMG